MLPLKMIVPGYLILLNAIGFFLMGLDKWKARNRRWRIAEKTLFLAAITGGSLGCILGMYTFRHKTKHWYFAVGMPVILVAQLSAILFLTFKM